MKMIMIIIIMTRRKRIIKVIMIKMIITIIANRAMKHRGQMITNIKNCKLPFNKTVVERVCISGDERATPVNLDELNERKKKGRI
jgi:hypothetical protein